MNPEPSNPHLFITRSRGDPFRAATCFSLCAMALLMLTQSAAGITVISQAPNTEIVLGLPTSQLEFENPLAGTETVYGYKILDWRDADYQAPAWYDDWTVSHPGAIDGNPSEIWMRAAGHSIWTTTLAASKIVSIHLPGDSNDGLAQIMVDGGEVARLDMNSSPPDRALIIVKALANTTHTIKVNDLGPGAAGLDDAHCFGAAALTRVFDVKWNQPPQPANPADLYYGWNEPSLYEHESAPPNDWTGVGAADDWACSTNDPVTTIRWWGSYIGWQETIPPPTDFLPSRYRLTIWTDVPAGIEPFSHPGQVLWRYDVTTLPTAQFVGYDYDPQNQAWESCFFYNIDLPPENYFCQTGANNIYWLSIAAIYDRIPPYSPLYKWGWKTRPRDQGSPAPDDAVRLFQPLLPDVGMSYVSGAPIYFPTPNESWDMAFELVAARKQAQPPDLTFTGIDVNATHTTTMPQQQYILADDFRCTQTGPIGSVSIWGSWYQDILPPTGPGGVTFTLSIHRDIPANPPTVPYSRPGNLVWFGSFVPGQFQFQPVLGAEPEGWMNPPDQYSPGNHQGVYRYDFTLPPAAVQTGTPTQPVIYWLDVHAVPQGTALFGWKTSSCQWNDDAVWGNGIEPFTGPWNRLVYPPGHPKFGTSLDFSFMIGSPLLVPTVKWSQPPQPYTPPDGFNGWNVQSTYGTQQIAADDWVCTTDRPVTDIHWWGSFLGWNWRNLPYSSLPSRFHLAIWTDVPAGLIDPFSHPGEVIWETYCDNYSIEFAGWDFDPRNPGAAPEACFKFEYYLPENMWFYQESGTHIYWLSIAAIYDLIPPQFPWGWKTTPRLDSQSPDDGVTIFDPLSPIMGSQYLFGMPIEFPAGVSWDLAFMLTTEAPPPGSKWSQPPHDAGEGFDAASDLWWAPFGPPPEPNTVVADDFYSDGRPIHAVRWWGSYFDARYAPGGATDPQHVLDGWLISFHWTDDGSFNKTCPPDIMFDPPPTVLGVYFAPPTAVTIEPLLNHNDCFNHQVYKYRVDLSQCCLICTESDPRTGAMPAQELMFAEEARLRYWLDIQAVTGVVGFEPAPGICELLPTGHLPPENGGHFWGWHTSPGPDQSTNLCGALQTACVGKILDFSPYPPNCWNYGAWAKQPWLCPVMPPDPIPPVHMAFDLITHNAEVPLAPWIVDQPVSVTTCIGYTATFTVEACGTAPLNYQWRRNGSPVGGNSKTLIISPVTAGDTGNYDVVITNAAGNVTSAVATLTAYASGTGDVNIDTKVNGLDIQYWVDVVLAWNASAIPTPAICASDMDVDGDVDTDDIPPFVTALLTAP